MVVFLSIIAFIVCYAIGGFNGAIFLSRVIYDEDIRKYGSKNPGFTNFKRIYGNNIVSWSVFVIDIVKTAVPVLIFALIFKSAFGMWQTGAQIAGFGCMVGHCFPLWYGFKGGKAFLAGFATIWFVNVRMALIAVIIFLLLLFLVKIMSVSSCAAALSCPISLAIMGPDNAAVMVFCILATLLVLIRHYPNFVRLINGKEPKFSIFSKNN